MAPLNEPSMEDILASIRRIIAEDQSQGLARSGLTGLTRRHQAAEAPDVTPPSSAEAVHAPAVEEEHAIGIEQEADLHQVSAGDMLVASYESEAGQDSPEAAVPEPVAEAFLSAEPQAFYPAATHEQLADFVAPVVATQHEDATVASEGEPLVSPAAGASITSSFQALAESVVLGDPGLVERVMRESMRPLLKEWLDDHLPSIVERLVRAEIERVARGGRGRD